MVGWQYACRVTNWFDAEIPRICEMMFTTMLLGFVMASTIPQASSDDLVIFRIAILFQNRAITLEEKSFLDQGGPAKSRNQLG
ncbi:hypothetical protein [Collimonas fungivorans]|nr:hypothetical protein [Collimonas fungivorans]